jgi:hypothetical protein
MRRRRDFIATLSGFAIKWVADSVGAHAEQRKARVGALMVIAESDPRRPTVRQSNRNAA